MIRDTLETAATHHQAGRLDDASRLYEEVLRIDPNQPDALHLLGVIAHQQGQCELAIERISRAISTRPNVAMFHSNLGATHHALGNHDKAASSCRLALRLDPNNAQAHGNLGNALKDLGKLDEAEGAFRRALEIQPDDHHALANLGIVLHRQGKLDEAEAHYRRMLQNMPDSYRVINNLGNILQDREELDEAESCFRKALRLKPDSAHAFNGLGAVFHRRENFTEAESWYRRTLDIDIGNLDALKNLGNVLQHQGRLKETENCYRRALQTQPGDADVIANLAGVLEKLNRVQEAAQTAAECLETAPDHAHAHMVAATCLQRENQYQESIDRLEGLLRCTERDAEIVKDIQFRLGRAYDRIGNAPKAFACYSEANRAAMQEYGKETAARKVQYLQTIDTCRETFTKAWVDSWSPVTPLDGDQTPAFLIGFPRSGTSLLDVILDSHPNIQTIEEKSMVDTVIRGVESLPDGYPRSLAHLTPSHVEDLRAIYFREADRYLLRRPEALLVDKLPLNTVSVGAILRVFPAAKFIMAVRHPCDVCLSCFMQNFHMNPAMANFTTLEDTATLYDKAMRLWRQYVCALPHQYHLVKYEDLVDNFEGETRRLLEFLTVQWDDAVYDYAEHAKKGRPVHTASYHQVVEPIHRRACGRWRRYAEQLAPVIDLLKPHLEYFAYDL